MPDRCGGGWLMHHPRPALLDEFGRGRARACLATLPIFQTTGAIPGMEDRGILLGIEYRGIVGYHFGRVALPRKDLSGWEAGPCG